MNLSSLSNKEYVEKYKSDALCSLTPKLLELIKVSNYNTYLDIGSGPGNISLLISNNFKYFMTVEPNSLFYKKYNFHRYLGNVPKYVQNINTHHDFNNLKFDLITCIHSFYYIKLEEYEKTLKKLYSLLNKNGKLVISLSPSYNDLKSDWSKIIHFFLKIKYNPLNTIHNICSKFDNVNIEIHKDNSYGTNIYKTLEEADKNITWRLMEELSFAEISKIYSKKEFSNILKKYLLKNCFHNNKFKISCSVGHIIIIKNK